MKLQTDIQRPSPAGPPASASPDSLSSPARILVIDDMSAIHDDFRKILCATDTSALEETACALFGGSPAKSSRVKFKVDCASQGQQGLTLLQQAQAEGRPYAVAFVDVRMPVGWDGLTTVSKLWEAAPGLQIVLCTAHSDWSWDELTRRLGPSDSLLILKKPFDNIEVLQLAHALCRKWDLARQGLTRMADLDAVVERRTRALVSQIEERRRAELRLRSFSNLSNRLNSTRTAKEAAQIIVDVADQLVGWDACICYLYSAEADIVSHVLNVDLIDGKRVEGPPVDDKSHPSPMARRAITEGGQLILRKPDDPPSPMEDRFGDCARPSASIIYVPIRNGQRVIGLLSVQSYKTKAYDQASLETLLALAGYCAGALDRIKTEEDLRSTHEQLRQSQKMEAMGQLAAGVAHDFNNLLAVIRGNTELALMTGEAIPQPTRDCLGQVIAAADRAANLTRQLLAFGRKQVMRAEPLNLNDVLANLTKMLKRVIGEDVQLQYSYAARLPTVLADVGMIEQVVMNLAVNARDAMPRGGQLLITTEGVRIDALAAPLHPGGRPGDFVKLAVADTGTGIAPHHLERVFEPFFTTKDVGKGTGLGLATVHGIVQQHHGWIEVSSKLGYGTVFTIYLPVTESACIIVEEAVPDLASLKGTESILVVEDDEKVRSLMRRVLERFGYCVKEAASGKQALEHWGDHIAEVDLLLSDIIMPHGISGSDLVEAFRLRYPSLKAILMTGYSGDTLGPNGRSNLCDSIRLLQKPCSARDLLQAVRTCLGEAPSAAAATTPCGEMRLSSPEAARGGVTE